MNTNLLFAKLGSGRQPKVLVIGDLMLDAYWIGNVSRISPEAPVPVLSVKKKNHVLGGAANVALNCKMLGMDVSLAGVVGNDDTAKTVQNLLKNNGIHADCVMTDTTRPTTLKTRIVATGQQIVRIDEENGAALGHATEEVLVNSLRNAVEGCPDIIVISDYGKGVVSSKLAQEVIALAQKKDIPVLCDPKGSDYSKYSGATIVSPNRSELALASQTTENDLHKLISAGQRMCEELGISNIVFTRSEEGISLLTSSSHSHFPATAREVVDVCGAGDAVISGLAFAISCGTGLEAAVYLGNVAGGLAVQKFGTSAISCEELLLECSRLQNAQWKTKSLNFEAAKVQIAQWKAAGEKVVFTNGCFDLFHVGHLKLLEACKALGTKLIVGVNSDSSVRRLKGEMRPVVPQEQRVQILAGLEAVDCVVIFEDDTPLKLIEAFKPDILAKGGDYTVSTVVGSEFVISNGGRVELIPLVAGISTSSLVERIKERHSL